MRRFWLSFSLFFFASNAQACLNDRDSDSLATQAKQLPDTLRVISGRFERNPPLYYQMRIWRSLSQLKKSPRQFALYDDIAVAYDRIHRDDDALRTMEQKKALLPPFDAKNTTVKEAWYRFYANAGTFHVHHWLGAGANAKTIGELKTAREFIKRAIQIKPNAHFGREKYQLMTMDWILAVKGQKTTKSLAEWIAVRDNWEGDYLPDKQQEKAIEGLSGLIVLGAAWESVDVFEALANALASSKSAALSDLVLLRVAELEKQGHASLQKPKARSDGDESISEPSELEYFGINDQNQKTLAELYPKLRANADDWDKQRNAFMMARLEKGRHPDTDPTFWNEWRPSPAPSLDVAWFNEKEARQALNRRYGIILNLVWLTLLAAIPLALWFHLRGRTAKRKRDAAERERIVSS